MKPDMLGFQIQYDDDSGVKFGVTLYNSEVVIECESEKVHIELNEIGFFLDALTEIRDSQFPDHDETDNT